jgi:hypothetical protein
MNLGLVTTDATKGTTKLEEIHPSDWLKGPYQVGNVSDTMNGAIYCPELIVNNDCQQFRIVFFPKRMVGIQPCFHFLLQILSLVGHVTVGAQESIPEHQDKPKPQDLTQRPDFDKC